MSKQGGLLTNLTANTIYRNALSHPLLALTLALLAAQTLAAPGKAATAENYHYTSTVTIYTTTITPTTPLHPTLHNYNPDQYFHHALSDRFVSPSFTIMLGGLYCIWGGK
jgi:hypothetical protein